MACLTSENLSIFINLQLHLGRPMASVKGTPSPYLFILCMEVLSAALNRQVHEGWIPLVYAGLVHIYLKKLSQTIRSS